MILLQFLDLDALTKALVLVRATGDQSLAGEVGEGIHRVRAAQLLHFPLTSSLSTRTNGSSFVNLKLALARILSISEYLLMVLKFSRTNLHHVLEALILD